MQIVKTHKLKIFGFNSFSKFVIIIIAIILLVCIALSVLKVLSMSNALSYSVTASESSESLNYSNIEEHIATVSHVNYDFINVTYDMYVTTDKNSIMYKVKLFKSDRENTSMLNNLKTQLEDKKLVILIDTNGTSVVHDDIVKDWYITQS